MRDMTTRAAPGRGRGRADGQRLGTGRRGGAALPKIRGHGARHCRRPGRRAREAGAADSEARADAMPALGGSRPYPCLRPRTCERHHRQRHASHHGPSRPGGRPEGQHPAAWAQLRGPREEGGIERGGAGQQGGLQARQVGGRMPRRRNAPPGSAMVGCSARVPGTAPPRLLGSARQTSHPAPA